MSAIDEKHAVEVASALSSPLPNIARADLVELSTAPGVLGYVIGLGWLKDAESEEQEAMLRELQHGHPDEEDEDEDEDEDDEHHGHSHAHGGHGHSHAHGRHGHAHTHGHNHDEDEDEDEEDDDDDEEALIRALLAPLAPGDVRVEWTDGRVSVHAAATLRVVARALLPADTVVTCDAQLRAGTVVEVHARADVKLLATPDVVLRDVPLRLVSKVQDPASGKLVVVRPAEGALAVGVVADVVTQLSVQLRDGSVCEVDEAGENGPFPADELDGHEQQLWGDSDFHPGMRVTAPAPFWQRQRFTRGQFRAPPAPRRGRGRGRGGRGGRGGRQEEPVLLEGVVLSQRVLAVHVDWLYVHACDPATLPDPLPLAQLVPFDHYAHLMTLVGDRISLAPAVLAAATASPAALAALQLAPADRVGHMRSLASCGEVVSVRASAVVRWQDGTLSAALDTATLREPLAGVELAAQAWQCGALVQRADRDDDACYTLRAAPLDDACVTICAVNPGAAADAAQTSPQSERVDATALLHLAHEQPRVADRVIVRDAEVGYVADVDPDTGAPLVRLLDANGLLGEPQRVPMWELHLLKPSDDDEDGDSDDDEGDEFDEEDDDDDDDEEEEERPRRGGARGGARGGRGGGAPRFQFGASAHDDEEEEDEDEEGEATGEVDTSKKLDFGWLSGVGAEGDATEDADFDPEALTPEERREVLHALHIHYHTLALPDAPTPAPTAGAAPEAAGAVQVVSALSDHHFAAAAPTSAAHSGGVAALTALIGALPAWCTLFVTEARLDLLRLVLRPAPATLLAPLALVVDVWLPPTYPTVPPRLWAHTCGERVHPALHASGRVCLRMLGEWRAVGHAAWQQGASQLVDALTELHTVLSVPHAHYFAEAAVAAELGIVLQDDDVLHAALKYDEHVLLAALRLTLAQLTTPPEPAPVTEAVRAHWAASRTAVLAVAEYAAALLPWRCAPATLPMPAAPQDALVSLHVPLNPSAPFLAALVALLPRLREAPAQ